MHYFSVFIYSYLGFDGDCSRLSRRSYGSSDRPLSAFAVIGNCCDRKHTSLALTSNPYFGVLETEPLGTLIEYQADHLAVAAAGHFHTVDLEGDFSPPASQVLELQRPRLD